MSEQLEVYLDHLIPRESLRYSRSKIDITVQNSGDRTVLRISDLVGEHISSRQGTLRKPDFQRATWSWTPEDCVSLLDSLVKEQVIPSVIMWSSPESGLDFVLDGAHRVSVVMAWLIDDWGDKLPSDYYGDEVREERIKRAAREVRMLISSRIGSFQHYQRAYEELDAIIAKGEDAPRQKMDPAQFNKARFYQKLRAGANFHILWVTGSYETAEQSFLKINKSGRSLDPWETKLIENRNSGFARAVMSIANPDSVKHYWPLKIPETLNPSELDSKVQEIIENVGKVADMLFKPPRQASFTRITQPPMDVQERYKRAFWIGELLTIFEGYRGQDTETDKLLQNGTNASPEQIILDGHKLLNNAISILERLVGKTQKSLSLVSSVYFYTLPGRYVRSLLYGFVYWMFSGTEDEVLKRMRIFSSYRGAFENVLLERKDDVATGITRKTASGPGVTGQTAQYYQELLSLLANYKGDIYSDGFREGYATLVNKLTNSRPQADKLFIASSRGFTPTQKSSKIISLLIQQAPKCEICGGLIDLEMAIEHDHRIEFGQGGETSSDNHRITHPFCNNHANRRFIETIQAGKSEVKLPFFNADESQSQLNFFDELKYV